MFSSSAVRALSALSGAPARGWPTWQFAPNSKKRRCRLRRPAVRTFMALDAFLRQCGGIVEFTRDDRCLLRIGQARARRRRELSDGVIERGAHVLEIHLWNERVPLVPGSGADLRWASRMRRGTEESLRVLAEYLSQPDAPCMPVAIRASTAFAAPGQRCKIINVMCGFGFEAVPAARFALLRALLQVWCDLYVTILVYTFNPPCLSTRKLRRERCEFWISRQALIARYAPHAVRRAVEPAAQLC